MISSGINYYRLLNIAENATPTEIKKAYIQKTKIHHPDRGGDESIYTMIQDAYNTLSKPDLRQSYDNSLNAQPQEEPKQEPTWGEETTWVKEEQPQPQPSPVTEPTYSEYKLHWTQQAPEQIPPTIYPAPIKNKIFFPILSGFFLIGAISLALMYAAIYNTSTHLTLGQIVVIGASILLTLPVLLNLIPEKIMGLQFFFVIKRISYILAGISTLILALNPITLLIISAPMWIAILLSRTWHKSKYGVKMIPESSIKHDIFGTPGDLDDAIGKFGYANVQLGKQGETKTAEILETFVKYLITPRIFHGLRFPGSNNADVDHAVLYGNKLALIDSKMWEPATYEFDSFGQLIKVSKRNGYETREMNFIEAVNRYAQIFPELEVQGWVLVHPTRTNEPTFFNNNTYGRVRMNTAQNVIEEIGSWFLYENTSPNQINRKTIKKLWENMK